MFVEKFDDILEGIFIIIEQYNEKQLEIKVHRKAFLLLMMIINIDIDLKSKEEKKIELPLSEFLRDNQKIITLSKCLKESKTKLDDLVQEQKERREQENQAGADRENNAGGTEEE